MLGIVAGIIFLLGAVGVVVICWRLDRVQKAVRGKFTEDAQDLSAPLSDYVDRAVLPDTLHLNFDMIMLNNHESKLAADPKWEFPRNQLIIEQTLGEGEFGRVLRARAKDIAGQSGYTTVAVKTLKEDAGEGASTTPGGPVYLIIEFAQYGSLRSYLRRSRQIKTECRPQFTAPSGDCDPHQNYDHPAASQVTPKDILSFAWQISNGMSYLSDVKLVHRDLAARNVLLATGKICKISDFGLTRDIYEDDAYFKRSKGRVPVKWMAPESLSDHLYTSKSDVWSFGILIWELVTLGASPYPGVPVQNLFHLLSQGYRMERPENCSPALYKVMRSCWHIDPTERPEFSDLASKFEKMLGDSVEYLDLSTNVIHNRSYFCMNFDEDNDIITTTNNNKESSINYLEKLQPYVKCGDSDKVLEPVLDNTLKVGNDTVVVTTQGYESPIKFENKSNRPKTPTNESPQYYTDMAQRNKNKDVQ
ncbi:Protein tyrosine and serine/threonine kinase [Popillia japonica]|uniref:Protein tyrosine and serine/threonine kinase n=1 Tax=Popillia japonica TaxID=7064 RepID=A0AAW1MZY9_POPJA